MNFLDFMQKIYAKNVNMQKLSVFNYDKKVNVFVRQLKGTKKDENVFSVFPPLGFVLFRSTLENFWQKALFAFFLTSVYFSCKKHLII